MVAENAGATAPGNERESRVTRTQARRASVLKHPDLARRLTEPPLGFRTSTDWSGYIPPAADPQDPCDRCRADPGKGGCRNRGRHTARLNDSARRRALVELVDEAARRANGDTAADG